MSYSYDITTSKQDNKAIVGLYACHTIQTIVELFISTFLVAYIYKFSNGVFDYIIRASSFELIGYAVMVVVYYFASKVVDKTNRIGVYRFALLCWASFVVFAVFYGERIADYIWLCGIICGIARGIYWASFNVLKQEMISRHSIKNFAAYVQVFQNVVSIVFPITLGALIEASTYSKTAIYVLIICAIQISWSFFVKAKRPDYSGFNVIAYLDELKTKPKINHKLKTVYIMAIFYSLSTNLQSLSNICIMLEYGSTMSFGFISAVVYAFTIVSLIVMNKFVKEGEFKWRYYIFAVFQMIGVLVYIIWPCKTTVILFNVILAIASLPFDFYFDVYRNRFLKENDMYGDIAEHQFVVELCLGLGRVSVYALSIFCAMTKSIPLFYTLLVAVNTLFIVGFFIANKFERDIMPAKTEIDEIGKQTKRRRKTLPTENAVKTEKIERVSTKKNVKSKTNSVKSASVMIKRSDTQPKSKVRAEKK